MAGSMHMDVAECSKHATSEGRQSLHNCNSFFLCQDVQHVRQTCLCAGYNYPLLCGTPCILTSAFIYSTYPSIYTVAEGSL